MMRNLSQCGLRNDIRGYFTILSHFRFYVKQSTLYAFRILQENILFMSAESLETSIEKCKCLILQCEESTSRRRALVHKLIQLRLRLQVWCYIFHFGLLYFLEALFYVGMYLKNLN